VECARRILVESDRSAGVVDSHCIDAATMQDVEDLMQLSGVRDRIPLIDSAMASQFASGFADRYRQQHPNANPAEVQRAATDTAERMQQMLKAIPTDELLDVMTLIYQKYLNNSDIKAINEFYGSPTGQKLLKSMNPMMIEAMQKHIPEIQAQMERAVADESRLNAPSAQLISQVPPVYPPLARQAHIQGTVVPEAVIATDVTVLVIELALPILELALTIWSW